MYQYKCVITRVVDGDTVDVDIDLGFGIWKRNERVRLHGIDTPESRTSDPVEKVFGKEAARVVEHFLPVGSEQVLTSVKDKVEKFGRTLGSFTVYDSEEDGETTINKWMIRNSYAVSYNGQSKEAVAHQHLDNYIQLVHKSPELINETVFNNYLLSRRSDGGHR